jgi:hypothetical protein
MDATLELHPSREDKYGSTVVDAYSDSDWATNCKDRKSMTGGGLFASDMPVLTFSRTQPRIALSSHEADLHVSSTVAMEANGLAWLLEERGEAPRTAAHCDASATLGVASAVALAS